MDVTLTWDLFIIVFFALVITYSFIIGKQEAVKVIIATYIASVAAEGIANIFERVTGDSQPILSVLGLSVDLQLVTAMKLLFFIALIIFIAVRAGVEIDYSKEMSGITNTIITAVFGAATAGLLLSTLLTFVADVPLLDKALPDTAAVSPLLANSKLMQAMVMNQDLWFALPALLLLGVGLISSESSADE